VLIMVTDGIFASQLALDTTGASGMTSAQSAERFQQAYARASSQVEGTPPGGAASLLSPLLSLDSGSARLAQQAEGAAAQKELKPSELMMLTMRSHEFLFHCELTANVANRSSDGVQQLFRQQS
jgi:hypothetical protein